MKYPNTTLAKELSWNDPKKRKSEYFFDRDPEKFKHIIKFLRTGWYPVCHPFSELEDELLFWGIDTHRNIIQADIDDFMKKFRVSELIQKGLPYEDIKIYLPISIPYIDWKSFVDSVTYFFASCFF